MAEQFIIAPEGQEEDKKSQKLSRGSNKRSSVKAGARTPQKTKSPTSVTEKKESARLSQSLLESTTSMDNTDRSNQRTRLIDPSYKNEAYYALPENVRSAIDVAKAKSKHSEFYYRLQNLNDKIFVFRNMYYSRMPTYQKIFLERKKKELEEELRRKKLEFIQEMSGKGIRKTTNSSFNSDLKV